MDVQDEIIQHDRAVRDAATAVDEARRIGDELGEQIAIAALEAADASRRNFYRVLRRTQND